jgi:hypothetical protein
MMGFLIDRYADGEREALRGQLRRRRPGGVPGDGPLRSGAQGPITSDLPKLPRAPRAPRHRRRADHALLRARRQHRPLRRGHRGPARARPARDHGLRERPRRAPGGREVLHRQDGKPGRRAAVPDRLLPGRRPGLQRRRAGEECWRAWTCPTSPPTPSSSRAWSSGRPRPRPDARRGDDDGRHPGARRRHRPRGLRRPLGPRRRRDEHACAPTRSASRSSPPGSTRLVELRKPRRAQGRHRDVQLPAACRQHRHGGQPAVFAVPVQHAARLQREGYDVDVPGGRRRAARAHHRGQRRAVRRHGQRLHPHPADDHVAREPYLAEIEAQWGPAPGKQLSDGRNLFVLGAQFGNVFVGVQPASATRATRCGCSSSAASRRRTPSAPSTASCARTSAPTRCCTSAPTARWSSCPASRPAWPAACWPDRLIGDLPNYLPLRLQQPVRGH